MAIRINTLQNQATNIAEEDLLKSAKRGGLDTTQAEAPLDPALLDQSPEVSSYSGVTPLETIQGIQASGADPSIFGAQAAQDFADFQAYEQGLADPVEPLASARAGLPGNPGGLAPIGFNPANELNPNEVVLDRATGLPIANPQQAQQDALALNSAELAKNSYASILNDARDIDAISKTVGWRDSNKKKTFANNLAFSQKTLLGTPVKTVDIDGAETAQKGISFLSQRAGLSVEQVALASEMARIDVAKLIAPLDHGVKSKKDADDLAGIYDELSTGSDSLAAFHTEEGTIGVELESFERNLGAAYRNVVDQAVQDPERRLGADEAENRLLLKVLDKNGDITYGEHQPTNGQGTPVGNPIKAVFIKPKLMNDYRQFRELSQLPSIKVGATKATGVSGKHIGPLATWAKKNTRRPVGDSKGRIKQERSEPNNDFNYFFNTLTQSPRGYSSTVLTTDALLINTLTRMDKQLEASQVVAEEIFTPVEIEMIVLAEASLKLDNGLSILGLDPTDFSARNDTPEAQTAFETKLARRQSKMQSVAKTIAQAKALEDSMQGTFHKLGSGAFADPSNHRNYVFAYNSSEQNNPFIRGAFEGVAKPVSKKLWDAASTDTSPLVTSSTLGNLRSISRRGGKLTPATREQTFLVMLGRQILPQGRNLPDSAIIQAVNKRAVLAAAAMGRALDEFNRANPSEDLLGNAVEAQIENPSVPQSEDLMKAFRLMGTEPKNKGSIEQLLIAAAQYVDGDGRGGTKITFTTFPDMNSAGRLNPVLAATGHLPAAMLGRMGLYIDQALGDRNNYAHGLPVNENEDSSLFPYGNPREFIAQQFVENLENAERDNDIDSSLAAFLKEIFAGPSGVELMDAFVKNPVMVVDYGMMISGAAKLSVEQFRKMIKNAEPEVREQYNAMVESANGNNYSINESIRIHMGETLTNTTNPQYSRSFQHVALGASILGIPLVYEGYDNKIHSVGSVGRKASGATYVIDNESSGMFYESEPTDDTSARAKTKPRAVYDKNGKIIRYDLDVPPVYSGQIQAWSPMIGQVTERALIAKSLAEMSRRFNEPFNNVLLDLHDSIGMDFEDSFHYQNILQELLPDILAQDLPRKGSAAIFNKMAERHRELLELGTIEVGPGSAMSDLNTFLDESFKNTLYHLRDKDFDDMLPEARKLYKTGIRKQLSMLRDAQQAGIWAPNIQADMAVEGFNFYYIPDMRSGVREIPYKDAFFGKFFKKNFMDPAQRAAKTFAGLDSRNRAGILSMIKDIDLNRLGFFRSGNETDIGWDT